MREFHSKAALLLLILIGFVFIGVGLATGMYSFPENIFEWPALAGIPPIETLTI